MRKIIILVCLLSVSILFAANPRSVYFPVTVGGETIDNADGITAAYWITARPGEVATQYIWVGAAFNGSVMVDLFYFGSPWAAGETLHCELTKDGQTGSGEVIIPDLTGDAIFPPATSIIDIPTGSTPTPTLVSPDDAAVNVSENAILSWDAPNGVTPTSYDVYFSVDSDPLLAQAGVTTTYYIPTLAFNTQYYWKVIAHDGTRSFVVNTNRVMSRNTRGEASRSSRADYESSIYSFTVRADENTDCGSGDNTGSPASPVEIDLPEMEDGQNNNVDPDVTVTSQNEEITVGVNIDNENNDVPNPNLVNLSFTISVTGNSADVTVVLGYVGINPHPAELLVNDGGWQTVQNPQWDTPSAGFVTFTWAFSGRGTSTFVLGGEGTLPVTLTNFNYTILENEDVSINWSTASEVNVSNFEIYRGNSEEISAANWIGQVAPQGDASVGADYSFVDENTEAFTQYYYWLRSIDLDLTEDTFGPISVFYEQDEENNPEVPEVTELLGNTPNPFNPTTVINFNLAEDQFTSINIYNTKGQLVKQLVNEQLPAGSYPFTWNGKDDSGRECSTGVYYYRVKTENFNDMRKMLLLK